MNDLSREIGRRVYQARRLNGWTLERTAFECHVSRSLLSKIENGGSNPQTLTLAKIAAGLNVPVASLLPSNNPLDSHRRRCKDA